MHVLDHAVKEGIILPEWKNEQWGNYKDRLQNTLEKGFRDVVKREVAQQELTEIERKRIIAEQKERRALERIAQFELLWGLNRL